MIYAFLDFEIDEELFEVRHAGTQLPAPPRVFDLVLLLTKHQQRVVTKQELLSKIWLNHQVCDDALVQLVRRARRLLKAAGPTAIQTIRGRGYRLTLPVHSRGASSALASSPLTPVAHAGLAIQASRRMMACVGGS